MAPFPVPFSSGWPEELSCLLDLYCESGRNLRKVRPGFLFPPRRSQPQDWIRLSQVCGSRPLPGAAYPVLEAFSCVGSSAALLWVERTSERNGVFLAHAKAESGGPDVAGWHCSCLLPYCLSRLTPNAHHPIRVLVTVMSAGGDGSSGLKGWEEWQGGARRASP